ncbi:MAG: hypothetical protein PHW34_13515 [Hespellia sp.]|nr:hypothetical protein [Hespellia sp.]
MENNIKRNEIEILLDYQKKYGARGSSSWHSWILRKRTVNIASMVIHHVSQINFSDFELAIYLKCNEPKVKKFIRLYEIQMEEAVINPERFVKNLDMFYLNTCCYIEENHLYRDFFDFCVILEQHRKQKIVMGHQAIFDAYISLLMQQTCYFCRNHMEDNVSGIDESGNLMFQKNPHPYSDAGCYELEKKYQGFLKGRVDISEKELYRAYKPYGYTIHSWEELRLLESRVKVYDNNNYTMVPYLSENTPEIMLHQIYMHYMPEFPRQWKKTDLYKEKLRHRNYMLPVTGVKACYVNAGDIKEIFFQEIFYNEEIVLLYKVTTHNNGEYSGRYHTKSQIFYSIYGFTDHPEWHLEIENFILENYMILTCDYVIDRKKNYAVKQVDHPEKEFHYPYQPLVSYTYEQKNTKSEKASNKKRNYVKENYKEEIRAKSGYIRNLPANYQASVEAVQYAAEFGLELPEGKTFVRAHEFRVYTKIQSVTL